MAGRPKKIEKKEDLVIPHEDGVVEVVEKVEQPKGTYGVELDRDIPYGPKKGTRYFENKEDALAYQKRFGGKLV